MKAAAHILSCLLLAGCLTPPRAPAGSPGTGLPVRPWAGGAAALQTMADRDARLTSVRMGGTLELAESKDRSVLLEAVLVMETKPGQPPKLRLQAKKLGHTAFDLTLNDQGVWLADGREEKTDQAQASQGLARLAQGLRQMAGGEVWARAKPGRETPDTFTALLDGHGRAESVIHKSALVPLGFTFQTPEGPVQLRLEHAPVTAGDGAVFPLPCKLAVTAPHGRSLAFEAAKMEANPALPPAVFNPPKNAVLLKPE